MLANLETIKFKELYKIPSRNGLTKPKRVRGEGYKFVNMKQIFAFDRMKNIPAEYAPLSSKEKISSSLESLDLLFARQSLVLSGAGKCSIFLGDDELTSFESHLIRVRLDKERANPEYYFYYFKSHQGRGLIYSIVEQGAGQSGIRGSDLAELNVPDVNIKIQNDVANTLRLFDDKITLNRQMNATLEAMAQAIFKDWFVDFGPSLRKSQGETDPIKVLGGLIPDPAKASKIAALFPDSFDDEGLPVGWQLGRLADIAKESKERAKPESINPQTPYIGLEHMPRNSIALGEWETAEKISSTKSVFTKGQVLFGKLRPYFHKVGMAPINGICSTDIVVLDGKREIDRSLICSLCSSKVFVDYNTQASSGTRMPRTKWSIMGAYPIAIASEKIRAAYSEIVSPLHSKIFQAIEENQSLAETRDYLLPKLMSGEVRVRETEAKAKVSSTENVVGLDKDLFGRKHLPADQAAERDAVMVAGVIQAFDSDGFVVGNFRYQKGVYLLKRFLDLPQATTTKHAAGPYDSALRYEGGHKIAKDRRYIREAFVNGKTGNKLGSKISEATAQIDKFGLRDGLTWVANTLRFITNDELECLATVDFAINELKARGSEITVDAVVQDIHRDDVWRPKLTKANFRRDKIREAIAELNKLFGAN